MATTNNEAKDPHVIGIFGRKGGSGKTLISHLLGLGLGQLNCMPIVLQTDVKNTEPVDAVMGRPYLHRGIEHDDSDTVKLQEIFFLSEKMHNPILIIDGGANRRNVDLAFSKMADLILIPTNFGKEDLATAEADYEEITENLEKIGSSAEVYIVLNRWPGAAKKRQSIEGKRWVTKYIRRWDKLGIIYPEEVTDMQSFVDMANADEPKYTPLVIGKSRLFADLIAKKFGLDTSDESYERALQQLKSEKFESDEEHSIAAE